MANKDINYNTFLYAGSASVVINTIKNNLNKNNNFNTCFKSASKNALQMGVFEYLDNNHKHTQLDKINNGFLVGLTYCLHSCINNKISYNNFYFNKWLVPYKTIQFYCFSNLKELALTKKTNLQTECLKIASAGGASAVIAECATHAFMHNLNINFKYLLASIYKTVPTIAIGNGLLYYFSVIFK